MNFEIQVKSELIKQKKTISDLAKELNISVAYASDIIRENRKAEHHKEKICEILKIERKKGDINAK